MKPAAPATRRPRLAIGARTWRHRFGLHRWNRTMALRDWLGLLLLLMALAAVLGWQNGLGRIDRSLYDKFSSAIAQPNHDDIIIVAIDDFSLQQLGRWPWPRALHAQLLDRLSPARPRAVGLDVILVEPDGSDSELGAALQRNAATVLPVVVTNPGTGLAAGLPTPPLAAAARALGHINLEHDSDGVVRSVFLREGVNGRWWPHFARALAGGRAATDQAAPAAKDAPGGASLARAGDPSAADPVWQRAEQLHVPFAGSGQFQTVPYVAVLRGEVAPEFFRDKYVLVGATALGLSDAYPTPVSGNTGAMPGIEIHANILASLLDGRRIEVAAPWQTAVLSVLPVLLALLGYLLLSPRLALLIAASLTAATLLVSYLGLRAGVWMPPSAATIALVLSYPLWSWRRLEAAITYLGQEFIRLDHEPHLLPEVHPARRQDRIEDVLERRINAMKNAARRVRDLRKFVSNSLDNLPDATLVTTVEGQILLANRQAHDYVASSDAGRPLEQAGHDGHDKRSGGGGQGHGSSATALVGASVLSLLARLQTPQPIDLPVSPDFQWHQVLDRAHAEALANGIGVTDAQGRDLLVKSAPCYSSAQLLTGWIVSLTDISTIRAAERSRDETLRFLSHDMRAPQASILALLELQADGSSALPQAEFFSRIEKASRRTLGLADNFVQLARAESHEYRLDEVDFRDILFDATDEMWTLAKSKQIDIVTEIDDSADYPVVVDRALMTRALTNLLSNAINYSPEKARIVCALRLVGATDAAEAGLAAGHADMAGAAEISGSTLLTGDTGQAMPVRLACAISDAGYGIAAADQKRLFQRFSRVELPDQPRHDGIGLGLVFVKTVVERHQGQIGFVSAPGEGTCFTLMLPCHMHPVAVT